MEEYLKEAINVSKLREIGESYDKEEALKDLSYREGQEKGKKEGKKEGIKETARKMLEKGYKIEEIIEITGLSEKEIKMEWVEINISLEYFFFDLNYNECTIIKFNKLSYHVPHYIILKFIRQLLKKSSKKE